MAECINEIKMKLQGRGKRTMKSRTQQNLAGKTGDSSRVAYLP